MVTDIRAPARAVLGTVCCQECWQDSGECIQRLLPASRSTTNPDEVLEHRAPAGDCVGLPSGRCAPTSPFQAGVLRRSRR